MKGFSKYLKIGFVVLVPLVLLSTVIPAHAGIFTAFDSRTFIRETGQPVTETASFNIKNPDTSYTLHVYNGGINSELDRISSAVIKLNGATVFDTSDFNQQVSHLQKQVSVADSNQLEVELRSSPNSGLTILLEGVDNDPPIVNIISPQDGSTVKTSNPGIIIEYSDALSGVDISTVKLTVDGIDVTAYAAITETGITYTPTAPLNDGSHTITASVSDKAGNVTVVSPTFTVQVVTTIQLNKCPTVKLPLNSNSTQRPFIFPEPGFDHGGYDTDLDYYPHPTTPIKTGDVNGDGILDIVAVNQLSNYITISGNKSRISVMLGKGDGSFEKPISFAEQSGGNYIADISLGDFNNDTYPDLAVSRYSPNNVEIFLGNGDGTFRNGESYSISSASWWSYPKIFTGHFDGDRYEDIIISGPSGEIYFLHGNGDGTFSSPVTHQIVIAPYVATIDTVASDFNKDGINDLAITVQEWDSSVSTAINKALLLLNNGDGTFLSSELVETDDHEYLVGLAARDFNSGGDIDILIATSGQGDYPFGLIVLLGDGNGGFPEKIEQNINNPDLQYAPVKVSDFNGDNIQDIALLGDFKAYILSGIGDGVFNDPTAFNVMGQYDLGIGDFDNDGVEDIVTAGNRYIFTIFARGDGTFIDRKEIPTIDRYDSITSTVSKDFDGENTPDLAMVVQGNGNSFSTILNRGNCFLEDAFQSNNAYRVGDGPAIVKLKDLNGDGRADIVTANELSKDISVVLNSGSGLNTAVSYQLEGQPTFMVIEDLNGDGFPEIIATVKKSGNITVFVNGGDGSFQTLNTYMAGSEPVAIAVGDYNGDGRQDIAFVDSSKTASILLGDGDNTFKLQAISAFDDFLPFSITKRDFDEDGILDLAINGYYYFDSGEKIPIILLTGKGDGTFIKKYIEGVGLNFAAPVVMDTNKDGKLDLITFYNTATVYTGDGNGQFQKGQEFGDFTGITSIAAGDLDNDGIIDIIGGTPGQVGYTYDRYLRIWLGNGDGTFRQGTYIGGWKDVRSIELGDVDSDGIIDIVLVDYENMHVIYGSGNGVFSGETNFSIDGQRDLGNLAAADFNADNNQDIAVSISPSNNNRIETYWGTGQNTFKGTVLTTSNTYGLGTLFSGDFNEDGRQDMLVLRSFWGEEGISVFLSKEDGSFGEAISFDTGSLWDRLAIADINNDSHLDIILDEFTYDGFNYSQRLLIYTGRGDGTFQYSNTIPLWGESVAGIAVSDFNNDGFKDMAITIDRYYTIRTDIYSEYKFEIFINNGDGTFGESSIYDYSFMPIGNLIAQDFDHNGTIDLAMSESEGFSILSGNGDGTFDTAGHYAGSLTLSEDFNLDGRPDILGGPYISYNQLSPLRTPPPPPVKLKGTVGDGVVSLSWAVSTDEGIAGYNVYRSLSAGGGYVKLNSATVSSPAYTDSTAANGTTYYYTVSAVDSEGEESSYAQKVTAVPSPPDTIPPAVKITTPTSDETVISLNLFVSGTINETDATVTVNGISGMIQKNNNTFTAYDIPLSAGENTITVTALDTAGNSSTDSIKVVYVPTASISGVIKDEATGQAIQWASIDITDSEKTQSLLETGSDGSYFFGKLIHGKVTIKVNANNYDTVTMNKTLSSGEALTLDILLPLYPSTLRGGVYNASTYEGIGGATITVTDRKTSQSATTNTMGDYTAENIAPYDVTVTVSKPGYETYTEAMTLSNKWTNWKYYYLNPLPPSAPAGLTAAPGGGYITLSWDQSTEDLSSYDIYRSTTSGSGYVKIYSSPVDSLSYKDSNVSIGAIYYYAIIAVNTSQMESGYSAEVSATPRNVMSPTDVTATAGAGYVTLAWTSGADSDIGYYNIYRSTTSGSGYVLLNTSTTITYKDTAVTAGSSYFYVVTAVNISLKESGYSNEAFATPRSVISPTGLTATAGVGYVALTWSPSSESDISYYNIYRKTSSSGSYSKFSATTATSFKDTSVTGGATYYYIITAVNTSGAESGYSTEASATPEQAAITAPTGLTATAGEGYIELSWNRNPERDLSSYNIYKRTVSERGYTKLASTSDTSYKDTDVTADTTYYYAVTALNTSRAESGYSTEASATPTGPASSITFISPADGATLTASAATITGMVITSKEIGLAIEVTGQSGTVKYLAEVNNGYFAAMIDLQEGANTIKAIATDAGGNTEEKSITINATATTEAVTITANPESGIPATKADGTASLDVTLTADTSVSDTVTYSWDIEGDGRVDQEGVGLTEITASYQTPGLYFPTLTVTDTQRNTYTATTLVNVLDRDEMDALLKGKWDGMRGALGGGDIETAITAFEASSQETYRAQFTALQSVLADISSDMMQINLVKIEDGMAEYEIIATRDGVPYSFYLLFVKDLNGLWKVKGF